MEEKKEMRTENGAEKEKEINLPKAEKSQVAKDTNKDKNFAEETFIYIGPTTRTGLIENTIIKGTRESVEKYLKDTIEEIPQVKKLLVTTESLSANKAKVRQKGTLLNKYFNDILSLRGAKKTAIKKEDGE